LYSPWLSWSDIAAEWLKSKDYIELLMNFINSWLAEIWEEKSEETKPTHLENLKANYFEGEVSKRALVITAGVDVQKDYFRVSLRAWGLNEESWLVRALRVETWQELENLLFWTDYNLHNSDEKIMVRLACIDARYRTEEVYDFARKWKDRIRPIMGRDHLSGMPYRMNRIDRKPSGKIIRGGLSLWFLDTTYYKDKINRMVHAEGGDDIIWHIPQDVSDTYINEFCAEHKIVIRDRKKGTTKEEWQLKHPGLANHYFDTEVYSIAAADMIRVSAMRKDTKVMTFRPVRRASQSGKPWLQKRAGKWLK
jgi:phage terminase large subunit GpA-like protein